MALTPQNSTRRGSPARALLAALVYLSALTALAVQLATTTPWLGLTLVGQGEDLQVHLSQGPSAALPFGARLTAIQPVGSSVTVHLRPGDVVEEPDMVHTYQELDDFLARQDEIARVLMAPSVVLSWTGASGQGGEVTVAPGQRPLSDLPAPFWFPVAVAWCACLVAVWVWALRPRDLACGFFALTGLLLPLAILPAAVYGSRELGLSAPLFWLLKVFNHQGSAAWGAAFVGLFMSYPKRLGGIQAITGTLLGLSLWSLADVLRLPPDLDWGIRGLLLAEMLIALALAAWQWRLSAGQPLARAALRWFLLSMLLGSSLFILTVIVTVTVGGLPPMRQAYAFGFFLLIYLGIALGLGRYRLFELDVWAYRLLSWVAAAGLVLALDVALVVAFGGREGLALGLAVWTAAVLYAPMRAWLWQRVVHRPPRDLKALWPELIRMAFVEDLSTRERHWASMLERLFRPASLTLDADNPSRPGDTAVLDGGLALSVPPCAGLAGRQLRLANQGQRLFSPDDARFVAALCELMHRADLSQQAQALIAADERRRIAQDIHDDVGARLLMLIHRAPNPELAGLARAAMTDLRSALAALEARSLPLTDALADWRAEASERCDAAQVQLRWRSAVNATDAQQFDWRPRERLMLERAVRECITNALKHAHPSWVEVKLGLQDAELIIEVTNDAATRVPWPWTEGRGLHGMRQRLEAMGGQAQWTRLTRDGQDLAQVALRFRQPASRGSA